jgi:hypothetical protein
MPIPTRRPPKPRALTPPRPSLKRPAPDDDDVEARQPARKLARGADASAISSSMRHALEEDGIVLLEGDDDNEDDDDEIILVE